MNQPEEERPRRYVLIKSDHFEADEDRFILSYNGILGSERANEWFLRLTKVLDDLTDFPGPLAYQVDEAASAVFGRETRCLLYHGPTRRRSRSPARIFYTVLPPAEDDETQESAVFLLRLLHGSQSLIAQDDAS